MHPALKLQYHFESLQLYLELYNLEGETTFIFLQKVMVNSVNIYRRRANFRGHKFSYVKFSMDLIFAGRRDPRRIKLMLNSLIFRWPKLFVVLKFSWI